ncbi:Panacea domain-containing protein [Pedobacter nyackensis]|uniref:Uncharacterized phage-associated protein n=1 Tax=Pedobacter nyackensis TaxID=475255 RepID=A0A1W2DRY8_9SPHI|nr:Panacea domain-containing protein [Pedobacter nyackensis]SMD00143.1 Uncharacterized phage-associated protein [Pedobacter nyackensis]
MEITLAHNKALNALVYFTERVKPLYLTKAIKLLYLADEYAIKDSGVPITWLNYKAWKYGPVPEEIWNKPKLTSNLEIDAIDQINLTTSHLADKIILKPVKEFDDSNFSDYEIDALDHIVKQYGSFNAEQLVEILHKEGTLWHKVVERNNLQQQFTLKSNSDFIIEFTELLDTDFKKSAFEVAYQAYLMQANLIPSTKVNSIQ